ncbi:MAG: leucine-rich repeat domain-containing protein [Clostridia bacterium]|nr:leucine-rich repeat domain-containing protein [Clostridia bacterium]
MSLSILTGIQTKSNVQFDRLVDRTITEVTADMLKNLTFIGTNAFSSCMQITKVEIPDSITNVGGYAFNGCNHFTYLKIPSTVTNIGNSAFNFCSALRTVVICNSVPPTLGNNSFTNAHSAMAMYVPYAAIDTYIAATNWAAYVSRYRPLVESAEHLQVIDTTIYTQAYVLDEDKIYVYSNGSWREQ